MQDPRIISTTKWALAAPSSEESQAPTSRTHRQVLGGSDEAHLHVGELVGSELEGGPVEVGKLFVAAAVDACGARAAQLKKLTKSWMCWRGRYIRLKDKADCPKQEKSGYTPTLNSANEVHRSPIGPATPWA